MVRFSIRDVLWLTILVATLVAWRLDRDRLWQRGEADRKTVELYKAHKLDVMLAQILRPPPRPAFIKIQRRRPVARPLILDYQLPPADRTPWIQKVEQEIIAKEKQ